MVVSRQFPMGPVKVGFNFNELVLLGGVSLV